MVQRRLYKNRSDKIITGVCGGIARYLDIDTAFVRVMFIIMGFLIWGIVAYVLFAILMQPEPKGIRPAVRIENGHGVPDADITVVNGPEPEPAGPEAERVSIARRRAIAFGIFLMVCGALILSARLEALGVRFWFRFWPVAIIVVGGLLVMTYLKKARNG